MAVRLEWEDKPEQIERLTLPFQTVETINESRATRERDAGSLLQTDARAETGRNQLIWGDNKLVMSSLLRDFAGQVKLIYIDPPFDSGADFSYRVSVGDQAVEKLPSILEEHAYRDTWGQGRGSYLSMLYERLVLMHELLADDGSLFVHLDWHQSHYVKVMLDEIFGDGRFLNEIVWWYYNKFQGNIKRFASNHDVIFWYAKGESYTFHRQREKREKPIQQIKRVWDKEKKMIVNAKDAVTGKVLYEESTERTIDDVWRLSMLQPADKIENVRYQTQKPLTIGERVIAVSTDPGDLVADFFCGSGTALVAAERLGRRWIGCDLGRFAIHTTRKRLLDVPDCRPFDVKNLGAYERQRWQVETGNGVLRAYLDTILAFYRAEPVEGFAHLHGRKANRMVHVGATDAPVTIDETEEVMDEMADNGIEACDLLGWEWEMGLHDTITEHARRRGLDVRPRQIPREVMERLARRAARDVDAPDSRIRCIVSVLMLREGWDVRNVCVIVTLRPLSAANKILPEQALGRGLRRMTPPGSGFDERVVVIEHEAFRNLWNTELDGGLVVEREDVDKIEPGAVTIFPDAAKLKYDIVIPQLTRALARADSPLNQLHPADVPDPKKQLAVPDVQPDEYVKYRGVHLIDKGVIEEYEFHVPYAEDPSGVITYYTRSVAKAAGVDRLSGAFATLAPMVRNYLEQRAFERPVALDDKVILRRLAENDAQALVVGAFRDAIRALSITEREPTIEETALRVSETLPFPWSRETVAGKRTVFNLTPVDSSLEARFALFLDRAEDVTAWAKLTMNTRFALEYISASGALRYYYPDFVMRLNDDSCLVVETKGQEDLDVALKDRRAGRWCKDATRLSGRDWAYAKVPQKLFDSFDGDTIEGLQRFLGASGVGSK